MSLDNAPAQTDAIAQLHAIARLALGQLLSKHDDRVAAALDGLMAAAFAPQRSAFDAALARLIRDGVNREDIAIHYIPAIARGLGQAWVDGHLPFTDVSVGCARLQGYLRQTGLDWCDAKAASAPATGRVLLIVPAYEQHTLGATLLAGQLRAAGVDVCALYRATDDEMRAATTLGIYNAILVSCARSETLETLAHTIVKLRKFSTGTPVVLGGNVITQTPDAQTLSGADTTAHTWRDVLGIIQPETINRNADPVGA